MRFLAPALLALTLCPQAQDRTVLPVTDPVSHHHRGRGPGHPAAHFQLMPPAQAPNVVIVLPPDTGVGCTHGHLWRDLRLYGR